MTRSNGGKKIQINGYLLDSYERQLKGMKEPMRVNRYPFVYAIIRLLLPPILRVVPGAMKCILLTKTHGVEVRIN